ncbi:MAG: hypothetical protein ACTSPQ_06065 [Candidatus Helarchaeota archaeon]
MSIENFIEKSIDSFQPDGIYSVPILISRDTISFPSESKIVKWALQLNQLSQDRITISNIFRNFSSIAKIITLNLSWDYRIW